MKFYFSMLLVLILGLSIFGQNSSTLLTPCEIPSAKEGEKDKVLCGTYPVFENRKLKSGRKISLKIIVYPATGAEKSPDPFFYIPGGPGSSATEDAPYVVGEYAKIREHRDLVFLDQRGTGGSNPLNCDFFNPSDPQSFLGYWFPLDQVRKCRQHLEAQADLRLYVTSMAMDDLDEVRAALGYQKINIIGTSYGTRATQEYLKRYSKNVRAAILHGVSPANQLMPRDFPQHTERAINGVIDECLANTDCRTAFPNLRAEVKTVLETLLRGSVEVDVKFPEESKETTRVKLSRDLAAEAVRYMLYSPGRANRLPLFIHAAAQGNFVPLAESALYFRRDIVATGANGMYLSVTCAEDLPWIKKGVGESNGKNTFLGDYRLIQQREACNLWVRSEIPKDYAEPARSDVPVFIVTGQWDPVTPPIYGETVAKYLPNSLNIVVPSGGHGFGGLEGIDCISKLTNDFIYQGTVKGLDTSCVQKIRRRGFMLKFPEAAK